MEGHNNVARSVLAEELRVMDGEAREEREAVEAEARRAQEEVMRHREELVRTEAARREAEAEAERVLAEAKATAADLLAQAVAGRISISRESSAKNGSSTAFHGRPRPELDRSAANPRSASLTSERSWWSSSDSDAGVDSPRGRHAHAPGL